MVQASIGAGQDTAGGASTKVTSAPSPKSPKGPRRRGRWRRIVSIERLLGSSLLAALLVVQFVDPYPVELLRLKMFDQYQKWQPRTVTLRPVVIVDLDERSLAEIGQWPWSRAVIAQMVQNLFQQGAALVAFDVVFPEPDRMNPAIVADTIVGLDDATRQRLRALPSNDELLAQVMARGRVVLGQAGYWEDRDVKAGPPIMRTIAVKKTKGAPDPHALVPRFPDLVRNVPVIEQAALGHGIFSLEPEPDGIVRRVAALTQYDGDLYAALSIEMLRVAFGQQNMWVDVNEAGINAIVVGRLRIDTDEKGTIWPYFAKRDLQKYVAARDVLAGTVDASQIRGKLAIVGTSAAGLLDIRATPVDRVIPGVEVHAQLIESVLTGEYLTRPNYLRVAELALLLTGGLLMIWLVPQVGAKWTLLLFFVVAGAAAGTSWYLFIEHRILFAVTYSVLAILLLYTLLTYTGYAKEESERRQVRQAFGYYLSPAMVEKLADDPSQLTLGGETRPMTMLFCDVRGFTTISEAFKSDPGGLTRLINKLLTPLTTIILDHRGTVDKYMGDCIMAFWNAPLDDDHHARNACRAALRMNAAMEPLNDRLAQEAEDEGRPHHPMRIGIGINSGDVVVGNMGSDQRFDYSVLGDNVNLAARLEGQSKTYGVDVVIGENTYAAVADMATLELDLIRVKGKRDAVRIYTILGDESVRGGNAFPVLEAAHQRLLDAYRGQRWSEARATLAECRKLTDGFAVSGLYDLYAERLDEYESTPPGEGWDGVYVATTK